MKRRSSDQKKRKPAFRATFTNDIETNDISVASFFMIMQDKHATPDEIQEYITIGKIVDPFQKWTEIQRIADSLAPRAKEPAA